MAKTYNFHNDAKTIDSEYISDNMGNHETFFIEELRSVDSVDVQAGLNLEIKGYTETELATLASTLGLTLAVYNDGVFVEYLNGDNNIIDFSFAEADSSAVVDQTAKTIAITVVDDTSPSALVASFLLSDGATADISDVDQVSGTTANDFSSPVVYTITSIGGVEEDWTVTVTVATGILTGITDFSLAAQTGAATIGDGVIAIEVANGTVVTALVATFVLESGATAEVGSTPQVSETTANNFTSPVVYIVTAEDTTTTQNWTVTVTVAAA